MLEDSGIERTVPLFMLLQHRGEDFILQEKWILNEILAAIVATSDVQRELLPCYARIRILVDCESLLQ